MDLNMVDVMIENEEKNSQNRLEALEKRVQEQNDEIISLKTTLLDLVKRIEKLEPKKAQPQQPQQPQQINKKLPRQSSLSKSNLTLDTSSSIKTDKLIYKNTTKSTEKLIQLVKLSKNVQSSTDIIFNPENGLVKFFLRGRPITFYLPSSFVDSNNKNFSFDVDKQLKVPKQELKLEWVYGYRGKDCRSNLYYLPNGEMIYFIAGIVILHNLNESTQRYYLGHTDDVKALAIHPNKIIVATGQVAGHDKHEGKAHVRVWDSSNLNTLKIIGLNAEFQVSICCLAFSKADNGQQLAVIDDGGEKWISIWNWQNGQKLANTKCYSDLVFSCEFSPFEKSSLVTCGKQHVFFWSLDNALTKKMGLFESSSQAAFSFRLEKPKYILSISFNTSGELITGDSEGNLLFWNCKEYKINRYIKEAHEGSVFSILSVNNEASQISMITGGKNGHLIEWNKAYQKTGRSLRIPEQSGTTRVITQLDENSYLIGTTRNCILKANFETNSLTYIVNGHDNEVWGVGGNLRGAHFITCGYDKNLFYWDSLSHMIVSSYQLEDSLHCCNLHPKYDLVAVGFATKPKFSVFDLNERKEVFSNSIGSERIECISYSPNGLYLACGSRDNFIYIYSVSEDGLKYTKVGKCSGHSSFITHLDWSIDSEYLMSNSGDYDILTWHAQSCRQVIQAQLLRDLVFQTNTCVLSLNTIGIWNSTEDLILGNFTSYDGTDINACACSRLKQLCCCVDDLGKVNLLEYPCNAPRAEKRVYGGHSSHVTNVCFINNDTRIITTGGNDMGILQWEILNN